MAPVTWKNLWRNGRLVCSAGVVTKIYTVYLTYLVCHSVDGRKTAPADMQNPV